MVSYSVSHRVGPGPEREWNDASSGGGTTRPHDQRLRENQKRNNNNPSNRNYYSMTAVFSRYCGLPPVHSSVSGLGPKDGGDEERVITNGYQRGLTWSGHDDVVGGRRETEDKSGHGSGWWGSDDDPTRRMLYAD